MKLPAGRGLVVKATGGAVPRRAPIDFAGVAERADLRALVVAELGPPDRSRKWRCPFHDDHNPSLGISPDGRRFRCWSGRCGVAGDALDWVMLRDGLDVVEAARKLDPSIGDDGPPPRPPAAQGPRRRRPDPAAAPPAVRPRLARSRVAGRRRRAGPPGRGPLWSPDGRDALDWLRGRGLEDHTIRRFRLGFLAAAGWTPPVPWPDGTVAGIHHERGILIPWPAPGAGTPPATCPTAGAGAGRTSAG